MYIHIGKNVMVSLKNVIAIFDIKTAMKSESSKEYYEIAKEEGFIKDISEEKPKTIVMTNKELYLTNISSLTLFKRTRRLNKRKNY